MRINRLSIAFIALLAFSSLAAGSAAGEALVLRPGPEGKDAVVWSRKDATGKNFGSAPQFHAGTWTWNNDNLGQGTFRSFIEFDFKDLPSGASIKSARLFLHHDTTGPTHGHTSLSASDASALLRVKAAWSESTLTWENQPPADTAGKAVLAKSDSARQDYAVNVTAMVAAMLTDSTGNHGWLLKSLAEQPYNDLSFASGDAADSAARPKLEIEYELITTASRTSAAARGEGIRYRVAGGMLILERPVPGTLSDLGGRTLAAFGKCGCFPLGNMHPGLYLLRTAAGARVVAAP